MAASGKKVVVGKIATAWGVRGWVKVHSFTRPPERFLEFRKYYCLQGGQWQPLDLTECRVQGAGLVAHIAGCDDRDRAMQYHQCELGVDDAELPVLEEGDYYWHQLEHLRVISEAGGEAVLLGEVDHLLETGANDVLVVRPCAGSVDQRERLIPYLPGQYVTAVDTQVGEIRVDWDPDF